MIRYSIQPRNRIFVKGYGFLSFAIDMVKNISKNFSSKYSQKRLHHAEKSTTDLINTASKSAIASGDLICNKISNKISKFSRSSPQNNSETITNKTENVRADREIPEKRYISLEKRQRSIDDLKLI